MHKLLIVFLGLLLALGEAFADDPERLLRRASRYLETLPAAMPGSEKDSEAKIALGRDLFFDARLSINDQQSCSTCHPVNDGRAGMDNLATSPGAQGQMGTRNTPTVFNAGWQASQFWDGRAADLVEQAKGPIINPIEMAMPSAEAVEHKLRGIPDYVTRFDAVFAQGGESLTYDNVAEAIAAFERTLRTESRLDDFLGGQLDALDEVELRGLKTFIKSNCVKCHDGPLAGGGVIEKLGEHGEYQNLSDLGRFEVTGEERHKFMFKVPSLRNVELTAPYFHDGGIATLEEAVRLMARLQLGRELKGQEARDIVAFLKTMTGKRFKSTG